MLSKLKPIFQTISDLIEIFPGFGFDVIECPGEDFLIDDCKQLADELKKRDLTGGKIRRMKT